MDSMVPNDDDEGLWDELNYQQNREIAQHHARSHQNSNNGSNNSSSYAQRFARQTAQELSRYASVFYHAAADAWKEQKERQEYRSFRFGTTAAVATRSSNHGEATAYLQDFGIPSPSHEGELAAGPVGTDGLMQSDYISLNDQQQSSSLSSPWSFGNGWRRRRRRQQQQQQASPGDNNMDIDDPDVDAFVVLPRFRLRPYAEGWEAVSNLDLYFSSLYSYFYNRGMVRIVGQGLVQLITLVFTLFLSVFLFVYVDWKALSTCIDEASCRSDLGDYLIARPFAHWNLWTFLVVLYCLLFSAYTVFAMLSFLNTLQDAWQAKWVFEERLGISARRLQGGAVDWDRDVVSKLVNLQQSGEYRVAIHGSPLDALVIANRIMRKENFLVALFNQPSLLDLSAPIPVFGNQLFCSSLEWTLYFCILNFMFNHKYQIRPAFYLDPGALRRRFWLCGIAHLVFMPFLLFFMTLYFGFQHAYDWKNTKTYLGPKDWSRVAKWKFREFNELPHNFERRLEPSYKAANDYINLFGNNEILAAIGQATVFMSGSLGATLLAFAAVNDAILLHVKIADWNLLWYAGVIGAAYSIGKAMVPSAEARPSSSRNLFEEMENALTRVSLHTHYYPYIWKGRGWDESTFRAFSSMFQFKAKLFAIEILSLIVTPYILCVSLAKCAEPICEFVLEIRAEVAGAGDVCGYATFDFNRYHDEDHYVQPRSYDRDPLAETLTESILRTGNVGQAAKRFPVPNAKNKKMKQSYESFQASHPSWSGTTSRGNDESTAKQPEADQNDDLTMERELHIEAAAKQLETLAELEQNGRHYPNNGGFDHVVDESHIL